MGAQSTDPRRRHYDPQAQGHESPVQEVALAPFFLSKYELTQGQWQRCVGRNPSMFGPAFKPRVGDQVNLIHPVEQVSWLDCQRALFQLDLALPTEAQWEYGARGGTSTIWWTGDDVHFLEGADNIADSFFKKHGGEIVQAWDCEEWLDDGYVVHAPVGSFVSNPFGLHDVLGNQSEWCQDRYLDYDAKVRALDGERQWEAPVGGGSPPAERTLRGGDHFNLASLARAAARYHASPEARQQTYGVRPARGLSPP
jgi:formylglycine-generating enzyme required for sulfatase activity